MEKNNSQCFILEVVEHMFVIVGVLQTSAALSEGK